MKVAILSMQRIINYGSFLQSYALKRILQELGYDVCFIDIVPGEYKLIESHTTNSKWKNRVKQLGLKKIRYRFKEKKVKNNILSYQKEYLGIVDGFMELDGTVDAVVIGSDEVFNCHPKCSWGVSTQLYGDIKCQTIISYAASCGYFTEEMLPKECRSDVKKALLNQKSISVRDKNTYDFVKNVSGIEPEFNLDPVLIYSFDDELSQMESTFKTKEKFMVIYAYKNRINDEKMIREIKEYAKKHKLKTYCVGGMLTWCDEYKTWNPFEVLAGFKNAECIVTDTFHGSIISAKYNKKFVTITRDNNNNKVYDLLERLDMKDRIWEKGVSLEEKMEQSIDYSKITELTSSEYNKTIEYLKNNLK